MPQKRVTGSAGEPVWAGVVSSCRGKCMCSGGVGGPTRRVSGVGYGVVGYTSRGGWGDEIVTAGSVMSTQLIG